MPRRAFFTPVRGGSVLSGVGRGVEQAAANFESGRARMREEERMADETAYRRGRDVLGDERYNEAMDQRLRDAGWRQGAAPTRPGGTGFDGMEFMVPDPEYETLAGPGGGYHRMRPEARFGRIANSLIRADPRFAQVDPAELGEGLRADLDPEMMLPWDQRTPELAARRRAGERERVARLGQLHELSMLNERLAEAAENQEYDRGTREIIAGIQAQAAQDLARLQSDLRIGEYEAYQRLFGGGGGGGGAPGQPEAGAADAIDYEEALGPYREAFERVGGDEARFTQLLADAGIDADDITFIVEALKANAPAIP